MLLVTGAGPGCNTAPPVAAPVRWEYANLTTMAVTRGANSSTSIIWTAPDTTFQADTFREFAAHFPEVRPPAQLDGSALGLNVAGARGWELAACYAFALPAAGIVTECYLKRPVSAVAGAPTRP